MLNITITQQIKANVQQIDLIKTQNHLLLSQFIATDMYLDLLNETKLKAEPIESYVIDNTVQIKYKYLNVGFKVVMSDKELVDSNVDLIFKDKVSKGIKEIDDVNNEIDKSVKKIMEKFDNAKK